MFDLYLCFNTRINFIFINILLFMVKRNFAKFIVCFLKNPQNIQGKKLIRAYKNCTDFFKNKPVSYLKDTNEFNFAWKCS